MLALASSALRDYLARHGTLPRQALRTALPISLRSPDDDGFANKLVTVVLSLATDIDDPVQRLQAIRHESERTKADARSGGIGMTGLSCNTLR